MGLNWNEIKSRALLFSKTWADASNEDSEAKPFWIAFFEIFGITDKRVATFELNVKKLGGAQGYVDLFWPGVLLVEHKSRGKNSYASDAERVAFLLELYQCITSLLPKPAAKKHELPKSKKDENHEQSVNLLPVCAPTVFSSQTSKSTNFQLNITRS